MFFPLERMRKERPFLNQSLNILIVFLLTGLWHGITPPYIIWGLLHGAALIAERGKFGKWLEKLWRPIRHFYTLGVIMIGWVFFRSPDVRYALGFLRSLAGFSGRKAPLAFSEFPPFSHLVWFALAAAVLLSIPWKNMIRNRHPQKQTDFTDARAWNTQNIFALIVFIAGLIVQAGTQYLPFIYGEF